MQDIFDYDIVFSNEDSQLNSGWNEEFDLPLHVTACASYNEYIYLFGKTKTEEASPCAYLFDPIHMTYNLLPEPPTIFTTQNDIGIYDNNILLFKNKTLYMFNIIDQTYLEYDTLPITVGERACIKVNNYLYYARNDWGGTDASFYKYNISTKTSTKLADIPDKMNAYCLAYDSNLNNYIYIIGGQKRICFN